MLVVKHIEKSFSTSRKLLLLLSFIFMSATISAQSQKVTLPAGSMTVRSVFSEIEKQTDFMFIVRNNELDVANTVMMPGGESTVNEVLALILQGTDKTWLLDRKYIIIPVDKPADENKTGSIGGIIYDHTGENPQKGVSVEIIDLKKNTKTGTDGSFVFHEIPVGSHILKFTDAYGSDRYREVIVRSGQKTMVEVAFTQRELNSPEVAMEIISIDANPVKAPGSYQKQEENNVMPEKGTYSVVSMDKTTRKYQPKTAVKTNLLYWATTTPNVGLEFYLSDRWSLNTHFGYNSWKNSKQSGFKHWVVQPEARYWFCNVFERGFVGLHGIYGKFNIQDVDLPFTDIFVGRHYKGSAYGAGAAWGYHLPLGKRWGMEFSVGAGYVYLKYDKYRCGKCDEFEGRYTKHYFGPTKAAVSLLFMIN